MAYESLHELFPDGWREPGDDCERLAFYVVAGLETALGLGMAGWGVWTLCTGAYEGARLGGLLATVLGGAIAGFGAWFFAKESRHWDLRHLTAERMVAGGFLLGFALILLGLQIGSRSGSIGSHVHGDGLRGVESGLPAAAWLVGLGAADVTLFLVVGLMFAYAPALKIRRRIAGARIERRYALDDKLGEIDDHPCPREDGFTPVIVLRLRDGRTRTLVCAEAAYERARVGAGGTAVVRGRRLERFVRT